MEPSDPAAKRPLPRRIYIAGPMTGYADFNYPAFNKAAERLRAAGYEVLNPTKDLPTPERPIRDAAHYMRLAIEMVLQADAIALLPGWSASKGACLEREIAQTLGLSLGSVDGWALAAQEARTGAEAVA